MKSLNVIGAGHVGRTLARLWRDEDVFEIRGVLNRSYASAAEAVSFIGAGTAVGDNTALPQADVYLIASSDNMIASCARTLAETQTLRGSIVFHCSGSLQSGVLSPARHGGAAVASVHPIKSFADTQDSISTFRGTFCGCEGDDAALDVLTSAFEAIGGRTFVLDGAQKTIYHAAAVFAMNYLVALLEIGIVCYEHAGLSRELAMALLEPIIKGATGNVFRLGTAQALTGPVARGDFDVVERQLAALAAWDGDLERTYSLLGKYAVALATRQGSATAESLARIAKAFEVHCESNRDRQ